MAKGGHDIAESLGRWEQLQHHQPQTGENDPCGDQLRDQVTPVLHMLQDTLPVHEVPFCFKFDTVWP